MMTILIVAQREIKMGFRNPWTYSFMGLFTLFSVLLQLINQQSAVGYTSTTSSLLNLIVYLVPLMTLLIGSFSLTSEKEEGSWQLLSTYPLRTISFIIGKFSGVAAVLWLVMLFGYSVAGLLGALFGSGIQYGDYAVLMLFSALLVVLFLALAFFIGALVRNRWQALTVSVAVWFFSVISWASLLIAVLGLLPYYAIKPAIITLTILNPAELTRLFVIVKLGGGSIIGPEYYEWVQWMKQPSGTIVFIAVTTAYVVIVGFLASMLWERGRQRG